MRAILKSFHRIEETFDRKAEAFALRHPFLAFWVMFVGMPVMLLLTVSLSARRILMELLCAAAPVNPVLIGAVLE